jgi:3',5'-cyclic AMP phosphodiesterase CpdA
MARAKARGTSHRPAAGRRSPSARKMAHRVPSTRTGARRPSPSGSPAPAAGPVSTPGFGQAVVVNDPRFGEPTRSPDPTRFVDQKSDAAYYKLVNAKLLQPIPPPGNPQQFPGGLILTLEQALGSGGAAAVRGIQNSGRIVFHAVGDTGPTTGPSSVEAVADKMVADFTEADQAEVPQFLFHLGDVVYNFGEDEYYYDQFYAPFRDYQAPIFAIPGNHDGVTYTGDPAASLAAFRRNFCTDHWEKLPEAGNLSRTSMIQPSVYFTLDAPFVKIIGLYSNVLEDPGVISSEGNKNSRVNDDQLVFLGSQLKQLAAQKYKGALLVAVHHPPFTAGTQHAGSPRMLADLDAAFKAANLYPHAVLSGHAHNYQRFTRAEGGRQTPFIIAGTGGHAIDQITQVKKGSGVGPIRTPLASGNVTLESYAAQYGYLRVVVTPTLLTVEFHEAASGLSTKSPADTVTVDLATRRLTAARP